MVATLVLPPYILRLFLASVIIDISKDTWSFFAPRFPCFFNVDFKSDSVRRLVCSALKFLPNGIKQNKVYLLTYIFLVTSPVALIKSKIVKIVRSSGALLPTMLTVSIGEHQI